MPGDVVTVRNGIYREWVRPARGGTSEDKRIVYKAADGEDVLLLGSKRALGWTREEENIWKITVEDKEFFGDFNPFKKLTRHPEYVAVDESGDGWGWLKYGRWTHLGDVIINGQGLTEERGVNVVRRTPMTWCVDSVENTTTIWANFAGQDPNVRTTELTVQPYAFFPEKAGLNYITLSGFIIMNVACHWAPPTVFQPGAVGPNGGHHWVIENNIILYAKAAAISIGIPSKNIDPDIRGHHIIKDNVIMRCGQGGTTGERWNSNTNIIGNHIEDINYRKEFGGWETAAIKHHNGDRVLIKDNFIRGVYTIDPEEGAAHGIWNDYRNTNWNVTGNVIINTDAHGILSEANWDGPNIYSNNILINSSHGTYSSRGDAWIYNLFLNSEHKWQNQPWGDRPQIGNSRWFLNMFIGKGLDRDIIEDNSMYNRNVYLDGARRMATDDDAVTGRSSTGANLQDNGTQITLRFKLEKAIVEQSYPHLSRKQLDLPFQIDPISMYDFEQSLRGTPNMAGPFARASKGVNKKVIYRYPENYDKALMLLGKL